MPDSIIIGGGGEGHRDQQHLLLGMANRHGLVAGATGTGKTVTMQIMAEGFAAAGVPVFLADVKGDVSGMARAGDPSGRLHEAFARRAGTIGITLDYRPCAVTFWDIFGQQGTPIRATVAEMGPLLLARLLNLTDVQEGVLNVVFRVSDEQGLPLLDLPDLQALLRWCGENARELSLVYGNVTTASIGAIQRALLSLENQGGAELFGEPALGLSDFIAHDAEGRGVINILAADRLMNAPKLYAMFLLWLLSSLFEELPELGDPDKPVMVFFFDEAHLLFNGAPRALVEKVERVARLIRSKGVGIYFVTQNPADIPETVLGQLGNRIQHALRAFTARDRAELEKAARTYRDNPRFRTADAIREVGTGEALTSLLDAKGIPGMVERTLIRPPASALGPLPAEDRAAIVAASALQARYGARIDRDSAHEMLARRAAEASAAAHSRPADTEPAREFNHARRFDGTTARGTAPRPAAKPGANSRSQPQTISDALGTAVLKELQGTTGRRIVRGILGGVFKGR